MLRIRGSLFVLSLFLGSSSLVAAAKPKPRAAKPSPAKHNPQVEAQLRASFGRADLNKDAFLDEMELAKAFRGPNATPIAQPQFDDKGNFAMPTAQQSRKYPDQVYLWALDTDRDGKLSWTEFDAYGEAYAAQLKNMQQRNQQAIRAAYAQAQRNQARRRGANYSRGKRPSSRQPTKNHARRPRGR